MGKAGASRATARGRAALAEWEVVEHFGISWGEQAVHLDLDADTTETIAESIPTTGVSLSVEEGSGRKVPAQFVRCQEGGQVRYLADLKPRERRSYRLCRGEAEDEQRLACTVQGDLLELRNESFAIRISWAGGAASGAAGIKSFEHPRPLAEISGPIQIVRGPDGVWFGKGSWQSEARCRAFRCEIIEQGPVLIKARQTYELEDGGELSFEYTLDAVTPAIEVTQRSTSLPHEAVAVWEFSQPGSFEPTHAFWRPHSPEAWFCPVDHRTWYRQVYGLRWPETPDEVYLTAFYNWNKNGAVFWCCWPEGEARRDMVFIGAIRASRTRCPRKYVPYLVSCWNQDGRRAAFSTKLQEGTKHFTIGVLDRRDALPKDPSPESRIEGLYRQMHCLSLDDYHHMSLEWEGMASMGFPHLMISPDELPRVRQTFNEWTWLKERFDAHVNDRVFSTHEQDDMLIRPSVSALGSDFAGAYLATGDVSLARKAKEAIGARLDVWVRELAALGPTVDQLIGITFARPWRSTCIAFDMVAQSDAFTAMERMEFLRKFAFIAEATSTHDAWPLRESGLDFPNPNFHADYLTGKGIGAALLSGHPRQREWMSYAISEASYFLRSFHLPNGVGEEAATYQLVSLSYLLFLATAVRHAGGEDLWAIEPMLKKSFDFLASTQTPRDPRAGYCMLPTVGNITGWGWCQSLQTYFAWAAKATSESDPAFSRRMMAAWRRAGSLPIALHDWIHGAIWWPPLCLLDRRLPDEPDPAYARSKISEGFGAILRAARSAGEEGYLMVKMGSARGHYDSDEGSLIWYAYGKPILADFGCQYNPTILCSWLHNRISFDKWNERHETCFTISRSKLGDKVDYIRGEMTLDHLFRWEDWPIRRTHVDHRLFPDPRQIDPVTWRRHVLYIHECEAIVLFDEIDGTQPTDWNLQVLAEEGRPRERAEAHPLASAHFVGQFGVDLDVHIASPRDPEISFSSFEHLGADEPRLPSYWWKGVQWAAPEGTSFGPMAERALTLRVRPPSREAEVARRQEYLALLLARRSAEAAASVSELPEGAGFEWSDQHGSWRVVTGRGEAKWSVFAGGTLIASM